MSNVILQPPRYAFNSLFSLRSFFLSDYQLVSEKQLTSTINQLLHRFQQKLIAATLNSLGGELTAMVAYFHLCDIYAHSVPSLVKSKISHIANPPISSNDSPSIISHLHRQFFNTLFHIAPLLNFYIFLFNPVPIAEPWWNLLLMY